MQEEIITDHATINIMTGMFGKVKKPKVFVNRIKDYTPDALRDKLMRFEWSNLPSLSLDEKAELLADRLKKCIGEFIVSVEVKHFEDNKWFDAELNDLKAKRDVSYKVAVLIDTEQAWNKNKTARNVYTSALRNKKKMFIENKLQSAAGNSKLTWKILKKLMNGKTEKEINCVNINGVNETRS